MKEFLENAIRATMGSSAVSMDHDRPYDGQPHTDSGGRGKQEVKGITMRDVQDCLIRAIVVCLDPSSEVGKDLRRKLEDGSLIWDNIYEADLNWCDPIAIGQNLTCEIEKIMGIYPNVPDLMWDGESIEN
jgi:hypothetical protein